VHHILIALENEAVPHATIADSTNHFPLINTLWESEVDLACFIEGLQLFGGEFQIQTGTRPLLGPCCDPACWETDFTAETTRAARCSSGKNSFIPSLVIRAPSALPFAVIFSAQNSTRQWRPSQYPHVHSFRHRNELALDSSLNEAVLDLQPNELRSASTLRVFAWATHQAISRSVLSSNS
jgi:hypothetical protein